ncbi:MAG: hypothetical protein L0241_09155 [Planctomycetia bacterium]|nr:hypothetical protein [Planctomycetia bacterium]
MSGRLASSSRLNYQVAARIAFVGLAGFACGLASSAGGRAAEDPPSAIDLTKVDKKDPLPADTPRRKSFEKFAIPNPDRLIFDRIEDFKPVASQDKNRDEYDAWIVAVEHANKFEAAELEQYAARDLVPLDLIKSIRTSFRLELIRFDGQMSCVRRLTPPPILQDAGLSELYEIRLVPLDESPLTPVSVVFTQLPESLSAVRRKAPGEWLDVDGWVSAAGFYFKTMSVPGERENAKIGVPVLIGKSITPLSGLPVPPGQLATALEKNKRIYKFVQDDAGMIRSATESNWPEVAAWNRIILHASRFSAQELETNARDDLDFAALFEPIRADYRFDLVRLEGRLISLKRLETNEWLRVAGVTQLYEGWLIPANEPSGNPVVIVFSEPLEGVELTGRVNKWVSFAGYSFKRMRYESMEKDQKNPKRNVEKLAPMLIGRSPIPRQDPDRPAPFTWNVFMLVAIVGGLSLILGGGVLAWWYRSGDRQAKQEMDAVRGRNPFDPATNPPA